MPWHSWQKRRSAYCCPVSPRTRGPPDVNHTYAKPLYASTCSVFSSRQPPDGTAASPCSLERPDSAPFLSRVLSGLPYHATDLQISVRHTLCTMHCSIPLMENIQTSQSSSAGLWRSHFRPGHFRSRCPRAGADQLLSYLGPSQKHAALSKLLPSRGQQAEAGVSRSP